MIIINTLYIRFVALELIKSIGIGVLIISQILFAQILSYLTATACTDPGIIPRAQGYEAISVQKEIRKLLLSSSTTAKSNSKKSIKKQNSPRSFSHSPYGKLSTIWNVNKNRFKMITKPLIINEQFFRQKYCYTCHFFRPPRSSHCSVCNQCIERFDHHCPWVGNCVGKRNYRSFYFFLLSLSAYGIFTSANEIAFIFIEHQKIPSFLVIFRLSPVVLALLSINIMIIWSILGLLGFHTYLLVTNMTTNEDIKQTFVGRQQIEQTKSYDIESGSGESIENPFSDGSAYGNCTRTLCSSRSTTYII
ncbi:hypothetical protein HUG17_10497 [Dermatophagoides farinae]|uniref:Palmitoyltransferase n=1 Tax=Dermatophagoides farinae TaxID=6954 RepID=A0A9D4NRI3_DERFA|nr:palmitoyltransferase ZDHHC18-like [Dermatophagoides farinae]KAH7636527.1 hypothetical protein HUG17_10497 [Dermatophagoides farinae]